MQEYYEPEVWIEIDGNRYELLEEPMAWSAEEETAFESSPLFYNAVRVMLHDEMGMIDNMQISEVIEASREQMSIAEFKFFKKIGKKIGRGLKKFGHGVVKFGKKALPVVAKVAQIAAPIVGTIVGGPAGAKIGGLVSQGLGVLTQNMKPFKGSKALNTIAKIGGTVAKIGGKLGGFGGKIGGFANKIGQIGQTVGGVAGQVGNIAGRISGGQSATNQILALLRNPAFKRSISNQARYGSNAGTVRLQSPRTGAQRAIPYGGFMNLLGQLANRAAREANGFNEDFPTYLQDDYGNFVTPNPADAEERAAALWNFLAECSQESFAPVEQIYTPLPVETHHDELTEWFVESGLITG